MPNKSININPRHENNLASFHAFWNCYQQMTCNYIDNDQGNQTPNRCGNYFDFTNISAKNNEHIQQSYNVQTRQTALYETTNTSKLPTKKITFVHQEPMGRIWCSSQTQQECVLIELYSSLNSTATNWTLLKVLPTFAACLTKKERYLWIYSHIK